MPTQNKTNILKQWKEFEYGLAQNVPDNHRRNYFTTEKSSIKFQIKFFTMSKKMNIDYTLMSDQHKQSPIVVNMVLQALGPRLPKADVFFTSIFLKCV